MLFSPRVRLILSLVAAFFVVFVVLRGAFFWFFFPAWNCLRKNSGMPSALASASTCVWPC